MKYCLHNCKLKTKHTGFSLSISSFIRLMWFIASHSGLSFSSPFLSDFDACALFIVRHSIFLRLDSLVVVDIFNNGKYAC